MKWKLQEGKGLKMASKKRVMVCVTQQKSCERLIKRGADLCTGEHDELHVVHVVKENWKYFGQLKESDALEYLFDISKTYGAFLSVIKADDIIETLSRYMEDHQIDSVIMGQSNEESAQQNMIHRIEDRLHQNIDCIIVPMEKMQRAAEPVF